MCFFYDCVLASILSERYSTIVMSYIYLSPPDISKEDRSAIKEALDSGWVAPVGPQLDAFETAMAKHLDRKHALAVNSGTSALHLALLALGVSQGDLIVCPTLTFAGCAFPIRYCGAEPVFIDSESQTWNMDPELLEEALATLKREGRTPKAVIVVQIYGQCAQMKAILELCQRYQIPVIEDAAESLGASYQGKAAGSFGDLSFLSFNGNKIITSSGGGMLLTNDSQFASKARYLAHQAREPVLHYEHNSVGYNYRLSNLLASLGHSQLNSLEEKIKRRKEHYCVYKEAFERTSEVKFMPIDANGEPNYWLSIFTIQGADAREKRAHLIQACAKASIEVRPTWKPLHLQGVFKSCRYFGGSFAETLFDSGLCLPSGSSLLSEERERVIQVIQSAL